MLATPGCWACDEIGAVAAGVFWGVLEGEKKSANDVENRGSQKETTGIDAGNSRRSGRVGALIPDGFGHGC